MAKDLEPRSSGTVGPSLARKAVAVGVLVVAVIVLLRFVLVPLLSALVWPIVAIAAIVGVLWAWRTLR